MKLLIQSLVGEHHPRLVGSNLPQSSRHLVSHQVFRALRITVAKAICCTSPALLLNALRDMYAFQSAGIAIARLHEAALHIIASKGSLVHVASHHILQADAVLMSA